MLNIFYGRESADKEKYIYEDIKGKEGRTIVIVPDQYTLEAEKRAFELLNTKGLMDVEIVSMSRLGFHLFEEQGGNRDITFIDKYGRHMLLLQIASEKDTELSVFQGSVRKSVFVELLNNFISEMKQYDITPEMLKVTADSLEEDNLLGKKLRDMYIIFSEYEKRIKDKYTDSEDYIDLYRKRISTSAWIRESNVWVYGFDSFAPKAVDLLGELMASAKEVNVFLTGEKNCRDEELFNLSFIVMKRLEKEASERGLKCRKVFVASGYERTGQSEGIATLEKELYAVNRRTGSNSEGITVVEAANIYNEAESAASYILHLLRDKGYRYRDIVVICNDQEVRASVISRIFEEYGINLFSDKKRSILSSTITIFITTLIDIIGHRYRTSDIFKLLKTGFSSCTSREIECLENYTIKYRIRGTMWKKPFVKGLFEYGEDELKSINCTRERVVSVLEEFEEICKTSENIREFVKKYYAFLIGKIDFAKKITNMIKIQQENGFMDFAEETAQTWNMIVGVFDQISEIAGDEKFRADEFSELLIAGLAELEIGVLPPTTDDILMGTMQRTRAGDVRAVLVLGANEGLIPQEAPAEGLFSIEELEYLADEGTELCKVDKVRVMEEKMAIYRNLTKAKEKLWISYAKNDAEGNELRPSEIIENIINIFPDLIIRKDVLNVEDETLRMGGKVNTLRHLTSELQKVKRGEKINGVWEEVYDWYKTNDRESLEKVKEGLLFTNTQRNLSHQMTEKLFQKRNEENTVLSPSQIEKFSRCPFSHFISYGLKPDERRVFEAGSREIGDVYHECLMKIAEQLTREDRWETITDDECRQLIADILSGKASEYREGVFLYSPEEEYKMKRLKDTCFYVCKGMIDQVRAGKIEKSFFEISFGRGKTIKPIIVNLDDKQVFIEGKIDRLDLLKDDRVKIIDYKTGNEKFDLTEAEKGYRLQLMLYLKAAMGKEKKPAGVFYFLIGDPQFDVTNTEKKNISEKISKEMRKFFKLNGIMVDTDEVVQGIAGEFEGFSDVVSLRNTKKGIVGTSEGVLLTEEEFTSVQDAVDMQIDKLCSELTKGVIDIHPKKSGDTSPCAYCKFKGICRFDTRYPGCNYEIIK